MGTYFKVILRRLCRLFFVQKCCKKNIKFLAKKTYLFYFFWHIKFVRIWFLWSLRPENRLPQCSQKKEKIFGKIFYKKCYTFEKILHIKYESEKRPPVKVNLRRPMYISSAFLQCRARMDISSTYAWRDARMAVDWLERR